MLVSFASSCCTPRDQDCVRGFTASAMMLAVSPRAKATVAGGMKLFGNAPCARKFTTPLLPAAKAGHQAGGVASAPAQAVSAVKTACCCGGAPLVAKLYGTASYAMPYPPRTAHLPLPVGSHANPMRGAKLLKSSFGLRKMNGEPARLEMAFLALFDALLGRP